jgi:hypothetical protein
MNTTRSGKGTRRLRFERVAIRRTSEIIRKINSLSMCANKNSYDYNKNDTKKIFNALEKALAKVKKKFLEEPIVEFTLSKEPHHEQDA